MTCVVAGEVCYNARAQSRCEGVAFPANRARKAHIILASKEVRHQTLEYQQPKTIKKLKKDRETLS